MAVRPIDGNELKNRIRHMPRTVNPDLVQYSLVQAIIANTPTLTPPNEPLTLDELREMDGEPVYVVISDVDTLKMWALIEVEKDMKCVILTNNLGGRSEYYDDDELRYDGIKIYRHPPEEGR